MCSQNAGIAISETQILKISWRHGPNPIANCATPLTATVLAYYRQWSAGRGAMAPSWQFLGGTKRIKGL